MQWCDENHFALVTNNRSNMPVYEAPAATDFRSSLGAQYRLVTHITNPPSNWMRTCLPQAGLPQASAGQRLDIAASHLLAAPLNLGGLGNHRQA